MYGTSSRKARRSKLTAHVLRDLLGEEFRLRWWADLTARQPEVAARLVKMYPERYPVKGDLKCI
jgi:hypothetical protein